MFHKHKSLQFQQEQEKRKIDWHDYKAIAEDEQRQGNNVFQKENQFS